MFERKKMVNLCKMMCLTLAMSLLCACKTDYTDEAIESARSYALKNLRGITESQRVYVRFSQPKIYENTLFVKTVNEVPYQEHLKMDRPTHLAVAPHLDFMHSCVVWCPPDLDGMIVVAGEGERSMRGWSPNNVQVKKYTPVNTAFESAVKECAMYAMNTMLYLSDAELNRVRFSNPEFVYTVLPLLPEKKAEDNDDGIEWNDSDENKVKNIQQSFIWPADKDDTKIVFYGYTKSGGAYQWKLEGAEIMSVERLNRYLLPEQECKKIKVKENPQQLTFPAREVLIRTNEKNRDTQKSPMERLIDNN